MSGRGRDRLRCTGTGAGAQGAGSAAEDGNGRSSSSKVEEFLCSCLPRLRCGLRTAVPVSCNASLRMLSHFVAGAIACLTHALAHVIVHTLSLNAHNRLLSSTHIVTLDRKPVASLVHETPGNASRHGSVAFAVNQPLMP